MWALAALTGDCINDGFSYENVWPFCRAEKKSCRNKEVTDSITEVAVRWVSTVLSTWNQVLCNLRNACDKFSGSVWVSGKLPTYPSPKPSFCPKSSFLPEGRCVGISTRNTTTCCEPRPLNLRILGIRS